MSKLRFSVTMSLDGYVAGPNQSVKEPLGVGGEALAGCSSPQVSCRALRLQARDRSSKHGAWFFRYQRYATDVRRTYPVRVCDC
jgi:hypothetical protein